MGDTGGDHAAQMGYLRDPADTDAGIFSRSYDPVAAAADGTTAQYSTGQWHHVCCVFTSNTSRKVYLDGANATTNTTSVTFDASLGNFTIGVRWTTTRTLYFVGYIAEACLWDIAISDADATELALGRYPNELNTGDVVAYWPLVSDANDAVHSWDLNDGGGTTPAVDGKHPTMHSDGADYDEGILQVSVDFSAAIIDEIQRYNDDILSVSALFSVAIVNESVLDVTTWPNNRPTGYDPDLVWDEGSGTWGASWLSVERSRVKYLVVVGEHGEIYFDEDA